MQGVERTALHLSMAHAALLPQLKLPGSYLNSNILWHLLLFPFDKASAILPATLACSAALATAVTFGVRHIACAVPAACCDDHSQYPGDHYCLQ